MLCWSMVIFNCWRLPLLPLLSLTLIKKGNCSVQKNFQIKKKQICLSVQSSNRAFRKPRTSTRTKAKKVFCVAKGEYFAESFSAAAAAAAAGKCQNAEKRNEKVLLCRYGPPRWGCANWQLCQRLLLPAARGRCLYSASSSPDSANLTALAMVTSQATTAHMPHTNILDSGHRIYQLAGINNNNLPAFVVAARAFVRNFRN